MLLLRGRDKGGKGGFTSGEGASLQERGKGNKGLIPRRGGVITREGQLTRGCGFKGEGAPCLGFRGVGVGAAALRGGTDGAALLALVASIAVRAVMSCPRAGPV